MAWRFRGDYSDYWIDYSDYGIDYADYIRTPGYWNKRSEQLTADHTREKRAIPAEDLTPNDFVEGVWYEAPMQMVAAEVNPDQIVSLLLGYPKIGPKLKEAGCEASDEMVAIYYNAMNLPANELVWKVKCGGKVSFIWTLGFPPSSAMLLETSNKRSVSSSGLNPNDFADGDWHRIPLEALSTDLGTFLQELMDMPKLGKLLQAKGCSAYENFVESVYINVNNLANEETIFIIECGGHTSVINTLGVPPRSVQELHVQ